MKRMPLRSTLPKAAALTSRTLGAAMLALVGVLSLGSGANAQQNASPPAGGPVVIELFSSQGCSACPPADQMLGDLAGRDGLIVLALHVDYWDYIGWEDTFARPEFTERQYGYGRAAGSTVVYTPQIVINGVDHVAGFRPMEVMDLIAQHSAEAHPVTITTRLQGASVEVSADWTSERPAPNMIVQLVAYSPEATVEITRGENAGATADYHNVARMLSVLADWDGAAAFRADVVPQSELPHVIIVQEAGFGAILGAAWLR